MKHKIRSRWSPRLNRTASIYAAISLFLLVAAIWAAGQNWVAYSLSGQPSCQTLSAPAVITTAAGQTNVPAACETGWTLAGAAQNAPASADLESKEPYWIPHTMGIPGLVLNVGLLAVITALGLLQRSALILGAGQYFTYSIFGSFHGTKTALVGGLEVSQYSMQYGWVLSAGIAAAMAAISLMSLITVATTNHRIRKEILTEASGRESLGLISDLRVFARAAPALLNDRVESSTR